MKRGYRTSGLRGSGSGRQSRTAGGPGKGVAGEPINSDQAPAGGAFPSVERTGGTGVAMSRCIPARLGRWEGLSPRASVEWTGRLRREGLK